jgi:hypothetical protein
VVYVKIDTVEVRCSAFQAFLVAHLSRAFSVPLTPNRTALTAIDAICRDLSC